MTAENDTASARVTVLLIDDQPIIGEAVRRMIAGEPDIDFHYLQNPLQAIQTAHSVRPTVILQDLVMPEVDGLDLVTQFRAQDFTREIPMIVLSTKEEPTTKAKAFAVGANDYLVKLPDRIELLARIRYHSKGYINLLQRNAAYRALAESQQRLADEIDSAAKYVQSLLPAKIQDGPVRADWQFIPSTALSGDTFGYHCSTNDILRFI
jgi:phosphoserine phosphatase RsbU/P